MNSCFYKLPTVGSHVSTTTHANPTCLIVAYVPFSGKEHNFNTYNDTTSSSLGVPYDYGSMMHYSKTAFSKEGEPTIVTNIPAFSDVIGQRMEFSDSDLLKLHRLYNCSKKCWISTAKSLSHRITWHELPFQCLSPCGDKRQPARQIRRALSKGLHLFATPSSSRRLHVPGLV